MDGVSFSIGGDITKFEGHVTHVCQVTEKLKLVGYNQNDLAIYVKNARSWKEMRRLSSFAKGYPCFSL